MKNLRIDRVREHQRFPQSRLGLHYAEEEGHDPPEYTRPRERLHNCSHSRINNIHTNQWRRVRLTKSFSLRYFSRKARASWSWNGLTRKEITERGLVCMSTSTGMPGTSLTLPRRVSSRSDTLTRIV